MPSQDTPNDSKSPQEEWTHVTRKSRKSRRANQPSSHSHANSLPIVPRTEGLRSPSDLESDYLRIRTRWETEPPCLRLRELVAEKAGHLKILSRAVNLGVGTFDPADGAWEAKRSAFVQLTAFLVMVEELEKITDRKIECVFQDPVFSASDKAFLTNLGHTVVETPAGCEMIDQNALFFGVHLYKPIYAMALEKNLPAIFVGTGWDVWDDLFATEGLENMEKMHKSYTKCDFPQDSFDSAFSSTSIYWKPASEVAEPTVASKELVKQNEDEEAISSQLESTTIS
ncbi:hypothetical protein NM208_g15658 [Fusarium decemcellulare]|uniref:Uncharacterized protein n=1 Tax=Fusarium decemcellulare TaxID=57161 RepID=A0ACC1RDX5_9HYPO|nr:hypothetical protein NM208_g15658 [Fusarium decemcellulare]